MKLISVMAWNKSYKRIDMRRRYFVQQPWAQGAILLFCVLAAMLLANLPFTSSAYFEFLETELNINASGSLFSFSFPADMTVEKLINDVLMTIFFFTVGLEIRREVTRGELCSVKKAILPVIAAFGGVIMPAIIYSIVNHGTAAASGWGIPTATDIAFVICILTVLGDKVPVSLKVFLTALAIADDLVAILVVALFYGGKINFTLLLCAIIVILLSLLMRKAHEKHTYMYLFMALIVWGLFYYAGIHSTMSGVVMAMIIPNTPRYNKAYFVRKRAEYNRRLVEYEGMIPGEEFPNALQRHCLRRLKVISRGTMGMADHMEHILEPWVNFLIMPLFALANAGVEISDPSHLNIFAYSAQMGSVGMGIFLGLLLGKPLGITLSSFLAIKFKVADMPDKATWPMFFAVAILGGIGFTMSIFVDTLSFGEQSAEIAAAMRGAGKVAVLFASIASGVLGSLLISLVNRIQNSKENK